MRTASPYRVGISGSYGGLNLGDEAILQAIVRELRRRVPVSILVFGRNPADTLARHDVENAVDAQKLSLGELAEHVRELDLMILGGGGLLFDREADGFLRPLLVANRLRIPAMTWAVGVGPLHDPESRLVVREALAPVALVTVRDVQSRTVLEDLGLPQEVRIGADPALLLEPKSVAPEMLVREGLEPDERVIGMSVRERGPAAPDLDPGHYHELLANTVDYVVERMEATVLFVPMERQDRQQIHGVASRVRNTERVLLLKGDYSPAEIRGLMPRFELAVGMRLHFLIFAASAGVPFVALPYGSKVSAFASMVSMPAIQATNAGQLLANVDRAWDIRRELRKRLEEAMEHLRRQASQTADWAVSLLRAGKPRGREHGRISGGMDRTR